MKLIVSTLCVVLLLTGCTRSISNSRYPGGRHHYGQRGGNPFYRGELSEFDLLGVNVSEVIPEEQIAKALDAPGRVGVRKGAGVLLIQSGAMQPDQPLHDAMERHFTVVPFSGQPAGTNAQGYARALRLAAAQAGCETIVCCWGKLETAVAGKETKVLSWVPVMGAVVPDEAQQMRLRLKVALVDMRSGRRTMFVSQAFEDRAHSARAGRKWADQKQAARLKQLAYAAAADELVRIYAR